MVWYPAYLDKQDIVDWVRKQLPRLTTGDIPDVDCRMADTIVFGHLDDHDIEINYTGTVSGSAITPTDINNYLWGASLAFNLEMLSYGGDIHYTPGGLQKTKIGDAEYTFMRMQPMFFLGQGATQNLEPVMPFRSYKQLGQWLVNKFAQRYHLNRDGTRMVPPIVDYDKTSRGYGWNADVSFMTGADNESSGLTY